MEIRIRLGGILALAMWTAWVSAASAAAAPAANNLRLHVEGIILLSMSQSASGAFDIIGALAPASACNRCLVQLEQMNSGETFSSVTDPQGEFRFSNMPGGIYTIHVSIDGFQKVRQVVPHTGSALTRVQIDLDREENRIPPRAGLVDASTFIGLYPRQAIELYETAMANSRKNQLEQATLQLEQALRIAPDFYGARHHLGLAYQSLGRLDDAERELSAAMRINTSTSEPLIELGRLYIQRNQLELAMKTSVEAIRRDARSGAAFLNLGVALYCAAILDTAEAAFKRGLELDSEASYARLFLASVYMVIEKRTSAVSELDRYLKTDRNGERDDAVRAVRDELMRGDTPTRNLAAKLPLRLPGITSAQLCPK